MLTWNMRGKRCDNKGPGGSCLSSSSQPYATQSLNPVRKRLPLRPAPDSEEALKEGERKWKLGKGRLRKEKEEVR